MTDAAADDERLVGAMELCDEYLADQQQAVELLKQGFLKLAMAKMNLPAHALSELSYKEEFESALYVEVGSDGSLNVIKAGDRPSGHESGDAELFDGGAASSPTGIKRRKDKGGDDSKASGMTVEIASPTPSPTSSPRKNAEDAAIMWFSSLPPQNLRLAQKHFRNALHALLTSATTVRKIQTFARDHDRQSPPQPSS